ncbi:hypothetical protein [Streptomyces flavofungini]|uniref:Histidine kinase n=1 Tax=Streptomyces flavofungini TaxID=68200 RepID=A0ABS0XGE7_9ACTN|nr:hypothetical protein [Streptomyces flavofungini]MBJ3812302.1 hypothetical protein [Streptomyces flavofungini]GHC88600.1 hypothetical protein GCM10010349_75990 [Streptomyces flavofungini]
MPNPTDSQPLDNSRPVMLYPGDDAIRAARHRVLDALAGLFSVLGAGCHRLGVATQLFDGCRAVASVAVSLTTVPDLHVDADPYDFLAVQTVLVAAFEGSSTDHAVLMVRTEDEGRPVVRGWRVVDGWLDAMQQEDALRSFAPEPPEQAAGAPDVPDLSLF